MDRFAAVTDSIFRGSMPSYQDILNLKNNYGVERIISLDQKAADIIHPYTEEQKIEHIVLPIKEIDSIDTLNYLSKNIVRLLEDKPTYIHCRHGKDRTGLAIALYRLKKGMDFNTVIQEMVDFDFGKGLESDRRDLYLRVLYDSLYDLNDNDDGDINQLLKDQTNYNDTPPPAFNPIQSFAPQMGTVTPNYVSQAPEDNVIYPEEVPFMGRYDNYSNISGAGPTECIDVYHNAGNNMVMINKFADILNVTLPVFESEKKEAETLVDSFNHALAVLSIAKDHLDIMSDSFSSISDISKDDIYKKRGLFNRYNQKLLSNFNEFMEDLFNAIKLFNKFANDPKVNELIESIIQVSGNITEKVNDLIERLKDYDSESYIEDCKGLIDKINTSSNEFEELINDRVLQFVDDDILNKNWLEEVSENKPIDQRLNEERQQALRHGDIYIEENDSGPSNNPSDSQRMLSGNTDRFTNIGNN
jgi:hypothetical protein